MIRSQKSQYDINREVAKTLATFSFSHLGKAFEKQTKTIKDQEGKTNKSTEEHGKQLVEFISVKEYPKLLKLKAIFEEFTNEIINEIQDLSKQIDLKSKSLRIF